MFRATLAVHRLARLAAIWLLFLQAPIALAQQFYPGGVVLDPVQPGNIRRIIRREEAFWQGFEPTWVYRPTIDGRAISEKGADADSSVEHLDWDRLGEQAFKAGRFAQAAHDWRHALVDEPKNGVLILMLAQSLFATGNFNEAAGLIQMGMFLLGEEKWGVVVKNYAELYPDNQSFRIQLRALEKARSDKPTDPALRFLLGYQYLYLGYPKQAAIELKKALELEPKDRFSEKLIAVAEDAAPVAK